jgi:rhodanese-related sulfurtransferase
MHRIKTIDAVGLHDWLKNDEAVVVDVREDFEFNMEHIPDSKHCPLSQICTSDITAPENQDKKIVLICRSGARSMVACAKFLGLDPSIEIYNLEGGIIAWKKCGYEIAN